MHSLLPSPYRWYLGGKLLHMFLLKTFSAWLCPKGCTCFLCKHVSFFLAVLLVVLVFLLVTDGFPEDFTPVVYSTRMKLEQFWLVWGHLPRGEVRGLITPVFHLGVTMATWTRWGNRKHWTFYWPIYFASRTIAPLKIYCSASVECIVFKPTEVCECFPLTGYLGN